MPFLKRNEFFYCNSHDSQEAPGRSGPGSPRRESLGRTDSAQLDSSTDGLTADEARQRLTRYGYNELPEEKSNPLLKFLAYFWGPIPWMIETAAILSVLVRHWADVGIISTPLAANAAVGVWEEFQAGSAIAAMKAKLAPSARAIRDGRWIMSPARELVPGDVIRLRLADFRISAPSRSGMLAKSSIVRSP